LGRHELKVTRTRNGFGSGNLTQTIGHPGLSEADRVSRMGGLEWSFLGPERAKKCSETVSFGQSTGPGEGPA
jgi:hypothetical protein